MANNITITEGTGKTVATDEVGSIHYQLVKLVSGTEGEEHRIGGSVANGLLVDVTRVIPGTGATALGKAEDAVHADGDTGVMALAVRHNTLAALAGSDGDYAPFQVDDSGALYVNTSTLTARARTTDSIQAALATDAIMNGSTALTPKFAKIAVSSSGNNTLISAVASKKIRVLALWFTSAGTVNVKFQDGAGGTDLTGLAYEIASTGLVLPFNPAGWMETSSNTLLNANLSAAIAIGGAIVYIEV